VAVQNRPQFVNAQELINSLGGIPPSRIRLNPQPGTAVEQDVIDLENRENRLCELIDGVLVEKTVGFNESLIAAFLIQVVRSFVTEHRLGLVAGPDGMMKFTKGQVRIPDLSYFSWDRLPGNKAPTEPVPEIVPDLVVEVLSKSNTAREMVRKLDEYFDAGIRLVWLVDPGSKEVVVYSGPKTGSKLVPGHMLDGGQVLPGFQLEVAKIFEQLEPDSPD